MGNIKKIVIMLVLILSFIFLAGCLQEQPTKESLFESVFELTCSSEDRFESKGTAFLIENGKVLTNAHIVSYIEYGKVILYEKIQINLYSKQENIEMKVVDINSKLDYAVLEPIDASESFRNIKGLRVGNSDSIAVGDSLFTIGNLNDYGLAYNDGVLSSSLKEIPYNNTISYFYQTNIEISKGSSGGPVFTEKREVVGIMTFKVRDVNGEYVDGMSFFIPINNILKYNSNVK